MMYRFETTTTMKEYNHKKYWIDSDIVRPLYINAETVREALEKWREAVTQRDYIDISRNALKTAAPMFCDKADGSTIQTGYVITGSTDIDTDNGWKRQYIDLWTTIQGIIDNVCESA